MLELRVVGYPQALCAGQSLKFSTRKGLALLVYLALEPRAHGRDQLMRLLWPESLAAGRGPLRTALTHLNRSLEGCGARVNGDASAVRLEGAWSLDLDNPDLSAEAVLLEGFSLLDAPEFDDWVTLRRERFSVQHRASLQQRLHLALEAGDTATALELARSLVRHDPLDESGYRALIELHLKRDERVQALETFKQLREVLDRELQTEPNPITVALLEGPDDNHVTLREARGFVLRGDPGAALNLLLSRASTQWQSGLVRGAAQLLEGALGIGLSASARAQVLTRLTVIRAELNQDALVASGVEELLSTSSSDAQRAEALSGLAMSLTSQGRLGEAERAAEQATALVVGSSDTRLVGEVAFRFMLVKLHQGEFALVESFLAAVAPGLEGAAIQSVQDRMALADVSVLQAQALIGLNRFEAALNLLKRAQTLTGDLAVNTLARDHVSLGLLLYHRATSGFPEALSLVQRGLQRIDFHFAHLARGELAEALLDANLVEAALEQIQPLLVGDHPLGLCLGQAALARLQHRLGVDATDVLERALRGLDRTDAPGVRACLARALVSYGNPEQRLRGERLSHELDDAKLSPQWRRQPVLG
jgi:DNA-binding SARP family transcriptional activator